MSPVIRKIASYTAIFSLFVSAVLTWTHDHRGDCGCDDHSNDLSIVKLANLPDLPLGDCGCDGCDVPSPVKREIPPPTENHDYESCSICRMILEHWVSVDDFAACEVSERTFDKIFFPTQLTELSVVSGYLTRGPPAIAS